MSDKVTAFTIDRTIWLRGEGSLDSRLLRLSDGKQCCLGMYSIACGIDACLISDVWTVSRILEIPEQMNWLISRDSKLSSDLAAELMRYNDHRRVPIKEREENIIQVFATQGITATFIN